MPTLTEKEQQARKMGCLPLDGIATMDDAESRVKELAPYIGLFKIGFGSFTRFGHDITKMVADNGADIFLDLKYHDIPNTVIDAAEAATQRGFYKFNVHASGGFEMMRAARKGVDDYAEKHNVRKPKITAVTVLTSLDEARYLDTFKPTNPQLKDINFKKYFDMKKDDEQLQQEFRELLGENNLTGIIQKQVLHLANLASQAGLDGIVCSAQDLSYITSKLPKNFIYVTPGIQGVNTPAGADQKRVMTPGNAVRDGASILVVGRAITSQKTSEARQQAAYETLQDIAKVL